MRRFNNDGMMTNAEETSDRDADKNVTWIKYWRAMTGNMHNPLYCSSCGKEIHTGEIPATAVLRYKMSGDKSSHKAEGGHVWFEATDVLP